MRNMSGFTLLYDIFSYIDLNNFRYYTDSEGSSCNPIQITGFENLIDFLLEEIKARDDILDKLKTTKEVSIGTTI